MMDEWFATVLKGKNLPPDRIATEGRVALLLCDGPQKWPYAFLDSRTVPDEFATAMRASEIEVGPDMAVSSMVPREIDLGPITEAAGETLERIEKWPVLRLAMLWALFLGALFGIFYVTR